MSKIQQKFARNRNIKTVDSTIHSPELLKVLWQKDKFFKNFKVVFYAAAK